MKMEISKENILNAISASKILEPHISTNPYLKELLSDRNNHDIHYGPVYVPTIYQKRIFKRRMRMSLENADKSPNAQSNGNALQELLDFLEEYPESQIFTVVFNCGDAAFDVWSGILGNKIQTICVMTGGHIPDELFEKETK